MRVNVNDKDIKDAIKLAKGPKYTVTAMCPVALGASRSLNAPVTWRYYNGTVEGDTHNQEIEVDGEEDQKRVEAFVILFDEGQYSKLRPTSFEVYPIPEEGT